jgi:FkbM family methyltransferase
MIGRLVKVLSRFGFEVRRVRPHPAPHPSTLARMAASGLDPDLVIDVGVANGTPELYEAFPSAPLFLVEPLREFEPALKEICTQRKGEYLIAAASDVNGTVTLNVHTHDLSGSSLYREYEGPVIDGEPRQVCSVRLDDVVPCQTGPVVLKMDVQGAELKVLEGAPSTLERAEIVMMEASVFEALIGAPGLAEVIAYMNDKGYVVYDIPCRLYRPLDGALSQVDLIFVKRNGRFRQEYGYATLAQRQAMWLGQTVSAR